MASGSAASLDVIFMTTTIGEEACGLPRSRRQPAPFGLALTP
jgi:hypothetical protein